MKAHDITVSTPRKGAASKSNSGDADDGEPKTPASKKRKRAAAKKEEEDDTPVKNEKAKIKAEKGRAGIKKEESDDDGVKVKGEADGSLHTPAAATVSCCEGVGGGGGGLGGGDVRMSDIPKAPPRRQCSDGHRPAEEDDGDSCVIVGERPAPASNTAPAAASVAYADGHTHSHNHGTLPTPNFGHYHHAVYCRDTNLAFPLQTMTTPRNSSSVESGIHDAATPSFGTVNWGAPQNPATPSEFYSGKHHLLQ